MARLFAALAAIFLLLALPAQAQPTNEDRLREALKRQTSDLRAAQDGQAALKAQVDELTKQRDTLQQQVEQLKAQATAKPAKAAKGFKSPSRRGARPGSVNTASPSCAPAARG
jgi:septal ring factor EnvC (AmiA/AmiB activator)